MAACAHVPNASSSPPSPAAVVADRSGAAPPTSSSVLSPRAARVYRASYVIDMHDDMPSKILDEHYDPDVRHRAGFAAGEGHTDLPRLLDSGVTAEFMSAFVDATYAAKRPDQSYARVGLYLDTIAAFARRHPANLILATRAADVRRAKAEGKVAIFIGVEGGHAIENSLDKLRDLYRRGARYMTLTWNNGNDWAGSSIGQGSTRRGGLMPFGRDVVREMNRLGMLVDLSHVSDSTFFDALAVSTAPVIASHSSARAINDHPRNLSDEQLRAIARNGGVVNVNFYSRFLDPHFDAAAENGGTTPRTPLSVLIDHIDHIARVAGVDHVGIGSDFDGVTALPQGMEDITRLPYIAQALLDRGYSDEDVKKILGGNMLRVMDAVLK
ncbi:MAG: membrane dipeptidase [Gemmatimonadaceae bacterium]|nr:membrane dipeptidase [Gemmatimonadaceae bacterium]